MCQSIAIVTKFAVGTGRAIGVVQALEALAGSGVARVRVLGVNVAIALTRQTLPTCLLGVTIVTRCAQVTARS